jgi:hypothetical protein
MLAASKRRNSAAIVILGASQHDCIVVAVYACIHVCCCGPVHEYVCPRCCSAVGGTKHVRTSQLWVHRNANNTCSRQGREVRVLMRPSVHVCVWGGGERQEAGAERKFKIQCVCVAGSVMEHASCCTLAPQV